MNVKYCLKCKTEKCLKDFYKCNSTKDGFRYWCKKCCSNSNKKYHENNVEKEKIRYKKYHENNVEKEKIRKHLYYLNNKPSINKRNKNYKKMNKEKVRL